MTELGCELCSASRSLSAPRIHLIHTHSAALLLYEVFVYPTHTHTHTHTHTAWNMEGIKKRSQRWGGRGGGCQQCLSILWFIHLLSAISEATAELSNQDCIVLQNKTLDERSWDGYYPHTWPLHESRLVTVRAECSCCRPVQGVSSE